MPKTIIKQDTKRGKLATKAAEIKDNRIMVSFRQ